METYTPSENGTYAVEVTGDNGCIAISMDLDLVLNGLVRSLKPLRGVPGEDFRVVAVGIDPDETPELARGKRDGYADMLGRGEGAEGWHFLTGPESSIAAVAESVGYSYAYIPETDEYAHAAGIVVLTPAGEVSHYFYGTEFSSRDLQFGLMEAGDGRLGSPVEKILLRCFQYDPTRGKYGFAVLGSIRFLGLLTLGALATFVVTSLRRDRRPSALTPAPPPEV